MVKHSLLIGAIALACSSVPASANTQSNILHSETSPFFGVRVVAFNPDSDRFRAYLDEAFPYHTGFDSTGLGLQFGVEFTNQWQLRSYYDRLRLNVAGGGPNAWGHSYGADALYRFNSGVYIGAGINNTRTNEQRDPMLRGTLGYRFNLRDRFFTAIEYNLQSENTYTDQQLTWTFNYRLGRDIAQQTLPREFRERRAARASVTEHSLATESTSREKPTQAPSQNYHASPDGKSNEAAEPSASIKHGAEPYQQPPAELHFDFDSAELPRHAYGAVGRIADTLTDNPHLEVVLIGHTDLTGNEEYNRRLSEQRAHHVATLLVSDFDIPVQRIRIAGVGPEEPVIRAKTPEANAKNRRVEVLFQPGRNLNKGAKTSQSQG